MQEARLEFQFYGHKNYIGRAKVYCSHVGLARKKKLWWKTTQVKFGFNGDEKCLWQQLIINKPSCQLTIKLQQPKNYTNLDEWLGIYENIYHD
jgi:hypothetical protein